MFQIFGVTKPSNSLSSSLLSSIWDPNRSREVLGIIVSRLLTFAIIGSGLLFFVRLLSAGYGLMTSGSDQGKAQNASKEITNSIIGLVVTLTAYFTAQILEVVFGIKII